MKRLFLLALCALILFSAAGCTPRAPQPGDESGAQKLRVTCTIFPQYDFLREIAGDRIALSMLLPPGTESHAYEPTPQDIIGIQESDLFVYIGGESDAWVERILNTIDVDGLNAMPLINTVDTVEEEVVEGMQADEDGHSDHGHDEEPAYDEHIWTSPMNAVKIVQALCDELCALDGENESAYRANTAAYIEKLHALDAAFRAVVDQSARRTIVFGDRFPFRYFAEEYGLTYYAAFPGCAAETEASAATVVFLIDKIRAEKIPVIFHIELSSEKTADAIASATGAQKLLMHSCHNLTRDEFQGGSTYLTLMKRNVEALKVALS